MLQFYWLPCGLANFFAGAGFNLQSSLSQPENLFYYLIKLLNLVKKTKYVYFESTKQNNYNWVIQTSTASGRNGS
jgi:hypothetical protein